MTKVRPFSLDSHQIKDPQFAPSEYCTLEQIKSVNENGQAIPLLRRDAKQEQSYYWSQKKDAIGLVIVLSMVYFIVTILDKSNLFQMIWDSILSFVWNFVLNALGMIK